MGIERESFPADRDGAAPDRPLAETDVLVVGAGVAGCAAAYYLAREGVEVVLIDRDDVNAHGSGGNAGSLHALIVSRFFKSVDPLWVSGRERLLPYLKHSIGLWRELSGELDCDIELTLKGGLMVAETAEELAVLERKSQVERRQGLDVEILTGADLRRVAPYLSDAIVGAEFCANEGKVNPLVATPALARGAVRHGGRMLPRTALKSLAPRRGGGFEARTSRGVVRCARVVNAAGAWSPEVAAMVGFTIPMQLPERHMNVTDAAPPLIPHLVQHADQMLSMKQARNGNVIIGGGWPASRDPDTGRPTVHRTSIVGSVSIASRVAPAVGRLSLIRTWSCTIFLTPDGNAVLGPVPGVPGFYNAVPPNAGYTGGPLTGRVVAEILTGRAPSVDLAGQSIERFGSLATQAA